MSHQGVNQICSPLGALFINHLVEGFDPLRQFGILLVADFINNFGTDGKFQNRGIMHCHIHLEDKNVCRPASAGTKKVVKRPDYESGSLFT